MLNKIKRWTIRNIDKAVKDEIVALAKHNGYTVERMIRELLEGYKK